MPNTTCGSHTPYSTIDPHVTRAATWPLCFTTVVSLCFSSASRGLHSRSSSGKMAHGNPALLCLAKIMLVPLPYPFCAALAVVQYRSIRSSFCGRSLGLLLICTRRWVSQMHPDFSLFVRVAIRAMEPCVHLLHITCSLTYRRTVPRHSMTCPACVHPSMRCGTTAQCTVSRCAFGRFSMGGLLAYGTCTRRLP